MQDQPLKISIIIAVYNAEATLNQCLQSVFSQTYRNIEVIIIDGNSSDQSTRIIKQNEDQISYFLSESDLGIYDAWNKGLTKVTGDWVCFLGADDFFRDNLVIERIVKSLRDANEDIDFAYSNIVLIDDEQNEFMTIGEPWEIARDKLRSEMSVPHPGMMHRSSVFNNGFFDHTFRIAGDYEFFLRESKHSNVMYIPDVKSVSMRVTGISNQLETALESLSEVRLAQKRHGYFFPSHSWLMKNCRIRARVWLNSIFGDKVVTKVLSFVRR